MAIRKHISKEELKEMPKAVFPGRIVVVQTEGEIGEAIQYLSSQTVVGIDSETRPSFAKGELHKVALLQISSEECCFLFRLNRTGLTRPIVKLLENPSIVKVGLSLRDDFLMLRKRAHFRQQSCIDLQDYVDAFDIHDKSLKKIYAILFGERVSKSQQLSNWDADALTQSQQLYAATDAWACLRIYNLLEGLKQTGDCTLTPSIHDTHKEHT
jgi:ribonuclease D